MPRAKQANRRIHSALGSSSSNLILKLFVAIENQRRQEWLTLPEMNSCTKTYLLCNGDDTDNRNSLPPPPGKKGKHSNVEVQKLHQRSLAKYHTETLLASWPAYPLPHQPSPSAIPGIRARDDGSGRRGLVWGKGCVYLHLKATF